MYTAGAVLGKKYLGGGGWPLIIWEATTAKRNLSEITIEPINSTSSRTTVSKNLGGLGKIWGPVPPDPNVVPPLVHRTYHKNHENGTFSIYALTLAFDLLTLDPVPSYTIFTKSW